jgi:hypothetical protein
MLLVSFRLGTRQVSGLISAWIPYILKYFTAWFLQTNAEAVAYLKICHELNIKNRPSPV